ncbi:nuclear transport factor 2 family protein [Streptomyces sp. NPDC059582]|uniref:nuclear transport factor 2 family protein n=1 Tax=Streptomyces sp. NPDC059582 TaxID=3346875 RepID=UPI0036C34C06
MSELTEQTRDVAKRWFAALTGGDFPAALQLLADDVEWINYRVVPGYNDDMKWIGTVHGPEAVAGTVQVFAGQCDVISEELLDLVVEGEKAAGVIHEISRVKETGVDFEIIFTHWLTVRDGRIVRWESHTDPSQIIRAIRGDAPQGGGS